MASYNLSSQKFGKLTAVSKSGRKGSNNVWECLCDCGNIVYVTATSLIGGNTKSCGCYMKDVALLKRESFVGNKYGKILVVQEIDKVNGRRTVIGKCECGNVKSYRASHLKYGKTISCGCYPKENRSKMSTKHGLSAHPLYFVWASMMDRCYNKKFPDYHNYGGRGIFVCEKWHSVSNFVKDMESGYAKGLELDRIDNDSGYSKYNCRFVTKTENNRNKRTNRRITVNGVTKTMVEWAEEKGIVYSTLSGFIGKGGDAADFLSKVPSN